jgi:serine/threonine-protein kinase
MRHHLSTYTTTGSDSVPDVSAQQPTIGMYHIEEAIGSGGMGTVYLGRHALLGRRAAIKMLLPSLSQNTEIVKRFFNEARALTRISDPGIVQIFDFGHLDDGSAFIVMEFLEGESMHARLRRIRKIDAAACLRLSRMIAGSLAAVHAKGIIHRDLKPGNIFIVDDASTPGGERTKIFDFGIAKQIGDAAGSIKTRAGMLMGTPMYMSPEQCRGTGDVDHRSDIYSLACVMFTMLTGRPPFGRRPPGELVVAHLREPAPLASSMIPEVPAIVDVILQRCLKKSPEERFQSMTGLAQAIGVAEQMLRAATTSRVAVAPADLVTQCSAKPSFGGQIAGPLSCSRSAARDPRPAWREGVAMPEADQPSPGVPATTRLAGASTQRVPAGARSASGWRRHVAVAVTASLIGVLCAFVIPGDDNSVGAPLLQPITVRAAARPGAALQRQPDTVDPVVPVLSVRASVSDGIELQDANHPGAATPPPPRRISAPAGHRPGARVNDKKPSHLDTRGDHASARQPATASNAEPQTEDSQNVTRGD